MKIPYGTSNFEMIRRGGYFYVDKTPYLPVLESAELGFRYLLFLRPRRMGKSALVSMLHHYYDVAQASKFDELFGGLWIHEHPTPERNSYMVLSLNFSQLTPVPDHATLAKNFCNAIRSSVLVFLEAHRERLPGVAHLERRLDDYSDAATLMTDLIAVATGAKEKLYVLIDEYDQFSNALLAAGSDDLYEMVTQGSGFVRSFYRALKAGTEAGVVGRMFVTGVTPILLDDVASGFNIISFISQYPMFNGMAGFTRGDVERAMDELLAARPDLVLVPGVGDREALLGVLETYYNGYRFSEQVQETVFNSDMVLYFLRLLATKGAFPEQMLDLNARTDYRKVQQLATVAGVPGAERRKILEQILDSGEVRTPLVEQFGRESLSLRSQFLSLLYYLGMLTLLPDKMSTPFSRRLGIPNRVIRELQWEHLVLTLKSHVHVDIDTGELTAALAVMARDGDIAALVDLFRDRAIKHMGIKDFRRFDERSLKLMLLAFLSVSGVFHVLSEAEFAQGYGDLFLGPSDRVQGARYSWLLELKYLPATAKPAAVEKAFAQAGEQLARYSSDEKLVPMLTKTTELRTGALVFIAGKNILYRAWPYEKSARPARSKKPVEKAPPARKTSRRRTAPVKASARSGAPPSRGATAPRRGSASPRSPR